MKIRFMISILGLAAIILSASPAHAIQVFTATLTGSQEAPPNGSPASGFATISLNDAEDAITMSLTFQDLLATQTAAHIHAPAPPGINAPVVIPLPLGIFTDMTFAVTPTFVGYLKDGLAYVNVHTVIFPGGEIRGQITPIVPEPATLLLCGAGLAGWGFMRARRKQRD